MGYMHIDNLYKDQTILDFKRCYAMEKIHGTSAHVRWTGKKLVLFSGGCSYEPFAALFDQEALAKTFSESVGEQPAIIYGEAYGGSIQRMKETYGDKIRFVAFEVQINGLWLTVPKAESFVRKFGLDFVHWVEISTDLAEIDAQRDADSVQAIKNGCGAGHHREGIVLRPLMEVTLNNGERVICKHKRDEFGETKTPIPVNKEKQEKMENAQKIAEEWVTAMRLEHILNGKAPSAQDLGTIIPAMTADIEREAGDLIVMNSEVKKLIGATTAKLVKNLEKMRYANG